MKISEHNAIILYLEKCTNDKPFINNKINSKYYALKGWLKNNHPGASGVVIQYLQSLGDFNGVYIPIWDCVNNAIAFNKEKHGKIQREKTKELVKDKPKYEDITLERILNS